VTSTIDNYRRWFARPPGLKTGEFSPSYLRTAVSTAPLLARAAPNAKLIPCVRDPIERLLSSIVLRVERNSLRAAYEPDVCRLFEAYPDLDRKLWRNF
jgi:hypothetical protein